MTLAVLLLLLQAAGPVLPDARGCRAGAPGEVVVCGRRSESPYRARALGPVPNTAPRRDPLAFVLPGGGTGRAHAITTELPGARGHGAAVSLAMPLGRKPR